MKYPVLSQTIKHLVSQNVDIDPRIIILCPELTGLFVKTYEFFLRNMQRLIRSVYENNLGGDFVTIAGNLISGQLRRAYEEAWKDEGTDGAMPDYLTESLTAMVTDQQSYLDGLYKDIVNARVDGTPIEPLLSRAEMWAGQYDTAYRQAVELIRLETGGNFEWVKGNTENGCGTCDKLNGIVMSAQEWQSLNLHPRGYPNPLLECQGGGPANNCDCELQPTDKRRTPKGYTTVLNIVSR